MPAFRQLPAGPFKTRSAQVLIVSSLTRQKSAHASTSCTRRCLCVSLAHHVDWLYAQRAVLVALQPSVDAARVEVVSARETFSLLPAHEIDKANRTTWRVLST